MCLIQKLSTIESWGSVLAEESLPDGSKYTIEPLQRGGEGVQPESEGSNSVEGRWDK